MDEEMRDLKKLHQDEITRLETTTKEEIHSMRYAMIFYKLTYVRVTPLMAYKSRLNASEKMNELIM